MADPVSSSGPFDVAIIGAGIAGLLAARRLSEAGFRTVAFDKSRGVGGRMSTRRVGDAVLDHGAQYFTARDPVFREMAESWLAKGLIHLWSDGFATADGSLNQNGEPRLVGSRGMTTVAKHLAAGLNVHLGATATACRWDSDHWEITFKEREPVRADALLLTCPVPQSLALLDAGRTTLESSTSAALQRIEYNPCLAALVVLDGPSRVPAPGGLWLNGEPVSWVGDNTQKGISPAAAGAGLTIHAGARFSRAHWNDEPEPTARALARAVEKWLGNPVRSVQLHRWKFSAPTTVHPERCLFGRSPGPLAFAGDAFAGPRVEGAALSGLAVADALIGARSTPPRG